MSGARPRPRQRRARDLGAARAPRSIAAVAVPPGTRCQHCSKVIATRSRRSFTGPYTRPVTRRALITGIGGQDGFLLAELLLDHGYDVFGIVRRSAANYPNLAGLHDRSRAHPG